MKRAGPILLTLLAYAALGTLIYWNVLRHGVFVMDDHDYVLHNPSVKNLEMMARDFWELRYVGYLTLALDYARAGFNPIPYHVVNFAIHVADAFLAFLLALKLSRLASPRTQEPPSGTAGFWLPFVTGLLFLVHPIQTTAASYISQRFTNLSALFYIGACLSYLAFRCAQEENRSTLLRRGSYVLSVLLTLLAMKTKESSFTIPVMLLFAEAVFLGNSRFRRQRFVYAFPHMAVAAIIPISIFAQELGLLDRAGHLSWMLMAKKDDLLHLSRYTYFINQLRIVTMYLRLLLVPIGQRAQYDFQATGNLFHPGVLFGGGVLSAFALSGYYWYRRARSMDRAIAERAGDDGEEASVLAADMGVRRRLYALASFGVGWFFIAVSVESSFIPIKHLAFEHRVYLPAFGVFLVVPAIATLWARRRYPEPRRSKILVGASLIVVAVLSATTYYRNRIWCDAVLLWTDVVEKSPGMLAGWHNRAVEYRLKGRLDLAMADMDRAVDHVKKQTHVRGPWPDPDLNPENASKVRGMRAKVALAIGDWGKAREDFRATVDLFDVATNKEFVMTVLLDIANGFLDAKLYPDAIDAYTLLTVRAPNDTSILLNRGKAYLQANFFQDSMNDFDRVASMTPNDPQVYFFRSMALGGLGQADRARQDLEKACSLGFPAACNQIGRPVPVPGGPGAG